MQRNESRRRSSRATMRAGVESQHFLFHFVLLGQNFSAQQNKMQNLFAASLKRVLHNLLKTTLLHMPRKSIKPTLFCRMFSNFCFLQAKR